LFDADGKPLAAEIDPNTHTIDDMEEDFSPRSAPAPDGSFLLVWSSQSSTPARAGIFARAFTADGNPRGPEFLIDQSSDRHLRNVASAADQAGNFVSMWLIYDSVPGPNTTGLMLRVFANDGTPLGDAVAIRTCSDPGKNSSGPAGGSSSSPRLMMPPAAAVRREHLPPSGTLARRRPRQFPRTRPSAIPVDSTE